MNTDFEHKLRADLLAMENEPGSLVTTQLNAAKRRALSNTRQSRFANLRLIAWPAVGMTLATVLTFVLVFNPAVPLPGINTLVIDEKNIDNLELIEDLDFYYWLADTEMNLRG